jgi:hypothetical protein
MALVATFDQALYLWLDSLMLQDLTDSYKESFHIP